MIQQTSRDAYESVNRADDTLYDKVLNCIYDNGSMTCDEVEVEIGGRHQSVSSRIRKGVQDGYLMNSGDKRKTRTGRNAIVWIIADQPAQPWYVHAQERIDVFNSQQANKQFFDSVTDSNDS